MEYKNVVELMEQGLTVANFVVCLTNLFKSSHEKAPGRCSKYVNEKCVGGDSGHEVYTLSHNLLLAHAEAMEEFRKCAKCKDGNIGIVRSPMWFEPYEKKSSSEEIVKRALDFTLGWHLESVTQGDYPLTMKDSVVTSAFVAHVDNVDQEKPSCEFSLQITFTKSRWVQDWFSAIATRSVVKFEDGYSVETVFDGSKLGIEPYAVEVLPNGELLVLDYENSNIYKISSSLSLCGHAPSLIRHHLVPICGMLHNLTALPFISVIMQQKIIEKFNFW
ncbi:unnamed protein product [Brassica napus]|uniref:thioglucosidase n=1 Tax=Brassica napus TaxID=3708 RepID=A0A817BBK1_BRANA|nr:unnamed protein product [Brassica napus]